ncbi:MAG: DUF4395 domain-containing protein [Jatrophihabitans sp.]|uniref:DUF4395 domain-containing protein n=1 Tax=Jatrophihabitans sp. TaxID=1932789 RepID=UPI003F7F1DA1
MSWIGFPNPVNEKAARVVAGGVVVEATATIVLAATVDRQWLWLSAVLAAGFLARVLTGPRLSPLGRLATQVVAPRLGAAKLVPGPPKRFAQAVGLAFTGTAVLLTALGLTVAPIVLLAVIVVFAVLESVFAVCAGCIVFARLMRWGVIPETVCAECADISLRLERLTPAA